MKLRIAETAWNAFSMALRESEDVETAGVILAEPACGGEVLVARHLLQVPADGYAIRKADQLQIDPVALNRLVHRARIEELAIITAHTHPRTTTPWFSGADDLGDARLMPSLYVQSTGPHGSLVIAGASGVATARVWRPESGPEEIDLRIVGKTLGMMLGAPAGSCGPAEDWFNRQELALGADGHRALQRLHVGVVGLGGTGSVCTAQLAHIGVGTLTLVDGDLIEPTNVSRIVGATRVDVGRTRKVDAAARYIERLGLGTEVRALRGNLGNGVDVMELATCDVVLSCVDRHSPRALLNRLAYEQLIPVIDMGSAFRLDHRGRVASGAGRVVVVGPGRPCLGCWGHIDPRELYVESLSPSERADQAAEGYIEGAGVAQPSVIPFNTLVAGAAVVELLRLVTAFSGSEDPPNRLGFDFELGSTRRNRLAVRAECNICGGEAQVSARRAARAVGVGDTR